MESQSIVPRACHNCRVRKIRCNREYPCSNCLTSNISCQPGARAGRAVPSPGPVPAGGNPNTFRGLHDRLARLENALENLSTNGPSRQSKSQSSPTQIKEPIPSLGECERPWTETSAYIERDPSFERQSYWAGRIAELAVPAATGSPAVADQFRTLNDAVSPPQEDTTRQKIRSSGTGIHMDHVPANFVLQLIRHLGTFKPLLVIVHPILDLEIFKSLCQRIYFPVDPVSVGDLTLLNGLLFFSIWEIQLRGDHDLDPHEIEKYRVICDANFRQGVESAEIAAVATYEHALTLLMAAYYSHTRGDLARHQAFITAGARHCLLLGYHRHDRGQCSADVAERRRHLFWNTYVSELGLTLRLGRAAVIQDYDIDAPLPSLSRDPQVMAWDQALRAWIKFSRLQGRIYRKLYSPRAASSSTEDRQRHVANLAEALQQWHLEWQQIDSTQAYYSHVFQQMFMAVDVIYYSVFTLLYRGSTTSNSPADISSECFVAARQGLEAHMRIFPTAVSNGKESVSYYGVWILMYSSFTPYVVTFLHCVAYSDSSDLVLLENVLETLEEIAESYERSKRQYSLCKALYRIAEAFLESSGNKTDAQMAGDKTLNLPLQLTSADHWGVFDTMVEGWDGQYFGQQSLMLDNCLD